jgi:NAD(P)-dependent dehydrogenase (short-subunit alcohol dehydrogenase family)
MNRLAGKIAIITGAGSGIGAQTAEAFAREGARVALVDVRADGLNEVVRRIQEAGGEALALAADVSNAEQVRIAVEKAVARFGRLDILVNNAGIRASRSTVVDLTEAEFDRTIAVDLKGVWLCCKFAIPEMTRGGGGSIVNVSSISARVGQPMQGAYNAAKGGVDVLTKCVAVDFAKHKIRCNSVNPGWVRTGMNRQELADMEARGGRDWEEVLRLHPLGRIGEPADVASAIVFLASDEASWITGISLYVDGGYTAQ